MARLAEVKEHAFRLFGKGEALHALRLADAALTGAPLDFECRLLAADCLLALGERDPAIEGYRAVARYALEAGHPLVTVVIARVLSSIEVESDDLEAALVVRYGADSELVGRMAARVALPGSDTEVPGPDLRAAPPDNFLADAARRVIHCTDGFDGYPEAVHAIPLLSELSEAAFRRVLSTLVVRRLPDGALALREGEIGQSFFFVASGEVRVYDTDGLGRQNELARLHEGSIFGEMALLSAQPRSASVQVVGNADLLEVTRESLAALADELDQVALALHRFTRDRLLRNLMARSSLFRPFDRTQQRDLLRRFTSHDVAAGTAIIREGDEGRGLYVVLSGEVEVAKKGTGGTDTPLATLRAGDVFGEMALLTGGAATATVIAARPSTVLFLAREYVARIVAGVPEIKAYLEALADDRALDTRLAMEGQLDEDEVILI